MGLGKLLIGGALTTGIALLVTAPGVRAEEPVGVVTTLEGVAMVSRITLPEPQPLQFKDDVYVRDRITTGERSIVRVLLGGKATVTARERSVLTITEAPGVSTIDLSAGRISVAVSKGLMKRGEVIEIKTPNAVSAIRGTIVVAEVDEHSRSTISVLRGLVDVVRLDNGLRIGPVVSVGAMQSVTAVAARPLTPPIAIPPVQATRLTNDFRIVPTQANRAATAPAVEHAMKQATEHANAAVAAGGLAKDSSARADGPDADDDRDNDRKGNGRDKDSARGKDASNVGHPAKEPRKGGGKGSDVTDSSSAISVAPQSLIDSVAVVPSPKKPKK